MRKHFPLFIHIENKKILVIGAGKVAVRRIEALLSFGADITVITKHVPDGQKAGIYSLARAGKIRLVEREVRPEDISRKYFIVLAASNDKELNRNLVSLCREKEILANSASCREDCDFYFPAIAVREDMVVAVAGDGSDHRAVADLAARVRAELQYEGEQEQKSRE